MARGLKIFAWFVTVYTKHYRCFNLPPIRYARPHTSVNSKSERNRNRARGLLPNAPINVATLSSQVVSAN